MSCGKVQNPPGFVPCRVAKSKTRRVSRYVVWQSPKPAGFRAMSCGEVQNSPNFSCTRVGAQKHTPPNVPRQRFGSKIGRVFHVPLIGDNEIGCVFGVSGCGNMKLDKFFMYLCRGVLHMPLNVLRRRFGPKIGRVLGLSLLGRVKSGGIWVHPCWGG